jgi:ATP-dependent helicase/nuclease subunit B
MSSRTPTVYSIPPSIPFADALAQGVLKRFGATPLDLARVTIFLPHRRAARALTQAFVRASQGQATLLPRLRALGDVDADDNDAVLDPEFDTKFPPAIEPTERLLVLAQQVHKALALDHSDPWPRAIHLARDLARLLDQTAIEQVDLSQLREAVIDGLPLHWRASYDVFVQALTGWQTYCNVTQRLDPTERRQKMVLTLAERWRDNPPQTPVIAAGSTGSVKATAALLKSISLAPQGCIVLPGLDDALDSESWDAADVTHSQHMMKTLLAFLNIPRESVKPWASVSQADSRADIIRLALCPPETAERWAITEIPDDALAGIDFVEANTDAEEARVIALAMREVLETPDRTAALVTTDRALARRVAAILQRFGLRVDDSAGEPYSLRPPGVFIRLLLRAVLTQFAPIDFLALLKHPLCQMMGDRARHLHAVRTLDRDEAVFRTFRPEPGLSAWVSLAQGRVADEWISALRQALEPLEKRMAAKSVDFAEVLFSLMKSAEALAPTLWHGADGLGLDGVLQDLSEHAATLRSITPIGAEALIVSTLDATPFRQAFGTHPRLSIWGAIEARLQRADLMILGGLNEGQWPPEPAIDPWLSPALRRDLGLSPLNRRIGQSAHDFVQALGAPHVLITRAKKQSGQPTQASRFWLRLLAISGKSLNNAWIDLARAIDVPAAVMPIKPPAPRPPAVLRPRKLSVTRIERLIQNPFEIYAREILRLSKLEEIDKEPSASDRGIVFHKALELFFGRAPAQRTLANALIDGDLAMREVWHRPMARVVWRPQFARIAEVVAEDANEKLVIKREISGSKTFPLYGETFTLVGKADRIDVGLDIIDYKTGAPPTAKYLNAGYYPQLPLLGILAQNGAFEGVPAQSVQSLTYMHIRGRGTEAVKYQPAPSAHSRMEVAAFIDQTEQRLLRYVHVYILGDAPFLYRPRSQFAAINDYDQLAREAEWGVDE